eukprot:284262-Amphidinium_carterae.2
MIQIPCSYFCKAGHERFTQVCEENALVRADWEGFGLQPFHGATDSFRGEIQHLLSTSCN